MNAIAGKTAIRIVSRTKYDNQQKKLRVSLTVLFEVTSIWKGLFQKSNVYSNIYCSSVTQDFCDPMMGVIILQFDPTMAGSVDGSAMLFCNYVFKS
jgi:hypothetical protein